MNAQSVDFSQPKSVLTDSKKELEKALIDNNGEKIVASLIDITLAKSMIDNDSIQSSINLIAGIADNKSDSPQLRAILDILQADLYSAVYNRNRWVYDSRELPLFPLNQDINQWSGKQFRHTIDSLIIKSLSNAQALSQTPIRDWQKAVSVAKGSEKTFPTLLDFIGFKAISLLKNRATAPLSTRWLAPANTFVGLNTKFTSQPDSIILSTYQTLLANDSKHPVSAIYTDLDRLRWTGARFSDSDIYFDAIVDLANNYPDEPLSIIPLFSLVQQTRDNIDRSRRLITLFKSYETRFGQTVYDNDIKKAISALTYPSISYSFPEIIKKARPFDIKFNAQNCSTATFYIYSTNSKGEPTSLVTSRQISFNQEIPFRSDSVVSLSIPTNGKFVVFATVDDNKVNLKNYAPRLKVGSIFPMATGIKPNKALFIAADIETGQPLENITVTTKNRQTTVASKNTDKNGIATLKPGNRAILKSDNDGETELYTYSLYNSSNHNSTIASFTTSLPVYHPGDEIQWALIAMSTDNKKRQPIANESFTVFFHDANNTKIDSLTAHTDQFGRISGSFSIPTGKLTGNYHLRAYSNIKKSFVGASSVMVSDYKLPTFAVKIESVERDTPSKGDITITGQATTYSGFPIARAEVTARLSSMTWNFWRPSNNNFYSTNIQTDDKGRFTVTFSESLLKQAPETARLFAASFDVTSSAGETRSSSCNFSTGKKYGINLSGNTSYNIADPVAFSPEITDPSGNKIDLPLTISLSTNNKEIYSSKLKAPDATIDLHKIKPGEYKLTVSPVDTTLADPVSTDIILYNPAVSSLNINKMLWTPNQSIAFDRSSGEILLATDRDNLWVNMIVTSPDSLMSQTWLTLKKGLNHASITLPDDVSRAIVTLIAVNNYESVQLNISITTPPARRALNLSIESFRDKVQPLQTEKWTFSTRFDNNPREAALLLNVFSASINDIKHHNIYSLSKFTPSFRVNTSTGHTGQAYGNDSKYVGFSNPFEFPIPAFDLHGYSWFGNVMMRRYATRSVATAAGMSDSGEVVMEYAVMMAAPMQMKSAANDMAATVNESAEEDSSTDSDVSFNQDIRPAEVPLALFNPMLSTNADGTLSVSFTWPDAVTEWIVNATAFDQNSEFATLIKRAVAAKNVMVSTNAPRFIRIGNHAVITSTVMNNTDAPLFPVKASIEIRSFDTNELIASADSILSLDPLSAKDITIDFDVDGLSSGLLVISRARSAEYSDGEQTAISVLPDAQPVIDTKNFYLAPGRDSVSFNFEEQPNGVTTLEVNLNPVWTVVNALPGLIADKPTTSVSAASSYFSALTALGLLNDNPEIKTALDYWIKNNSRDSVLVSALAKNADLKNMALDATPWVVDQMNDTKRMARLALLFDKRETTATINGSVSTLKSLFKDNRGWSWSAYGDKPSEWATMSVLYLLGNLNNLSYSSYNRELDSMIEKAVKYIDNQMVERQKKSKSPIIDPAYVYIRSLFSNVPKSTGASAISANTINHLVSGWKNLDVPQKALAAQLLYRNNYRNVAHSILQSISQFATVSPDRGMYWANIKSSQWWSTSAVSQTALILDAYQLIDPNSPDINKIRQWLILEKSRQNWGDGISANTVITAILRSGSKWTAPIDNNFSITVNQTPVVLDNADIMSGYFRCNISNIVDGQNEFTLLINKDSQAPAFGAVYNIAPQKIEDVKPSDNIEFAIEKRLYVREISPDGDKWVETDTFNVGDRVRTTLTIKSLVDLSYVSIKDLRPACFEPVNQLPETIFSDGLVFYRETLNTESVMFIDFLPRGVYVLSQEYNVDRPGSYSSGMAEAASAYSPSYTVHSAGNIITSRP